MYQAYQLDKLPRVALNLHQSVFISQLPQPNRTPLPCIIKCYRVQQKNEEQCLRKLQKSTHNLVVRPVDYRIIQGTVYFATEIQQMSLQTMIFLHKVNKAPMQKQLLKSFIKIFDTINKVHKGGLFHGNLKPSNIFVKFPKQYLQSNTKKSNNKQEQQQQRNRQQPNFEQIQWKLGQGNINQSSQNKYYSKGIISLANTSKSLFMDPYENDFYSLGVILLEMLCLQPIQKLHEDIMNDEVDNKYLKKLLKNSALIDDSRGASQAIQKLMDLIRGLLNPKNIPSMGGGNNRSSVGLNSLYHDFEESINYDRPGVCQVAYFQYVLTAERLAQNFIKQNVVESTLQRLKQNIHKQQLTCSQILKYVSKHIDPEDQFIFSTPHDFYNFIQSLFMYHFDNKISGLLFAQYFLYESHVHYMGILMKLVPIVQLANIIMRKAIDKFQSPSQLFKQQADGKDVWKAVDLMRFYNSLRVPFTNNQIQSLLRSWTNSQKDNIEINSLKLDQFKKVFKQYSSPKKTQRKMDDHRTQQKGKKIQQLFNSLKKTHTNLVHFFRIMPGQYKWEIPLQKARDQIKKFYKFRSQLQEKQIFEQVLGMARVGQGKSSIDYIKLLMKLNLYDPIELFRFVLVERINEDGIEVIYKKYQKDDKGWNRQSIANFCQKQYLSFDQKHQNFFFNMLDKDNSQYVDLKELMFKLTGLKQFDMEHFVDMLKQSVNNNGGKIFDAFLKIDKQAMFALNNVQELREVVEYVDQKIALQPDHYQQVFDKFATKKGKFQYLVFLRYFVSLQHIFVRCCSLLIDTMYRGNFEQFFKTGLKGQQKKWKRQSLTLVNDMALLKFKQKQLDQVWHYLDPNEENSLTKQQIAEKFNMKVQKLQEFKTRAVDSLNDFWPKKQQDKKNQSSPRNKQRGSSKQQMQNKKSSLQNQNRLEKNQLVVEMKSMRLVLILKTCFKNSIDECSMWIETERFCDVLRQQGLSFSKKFMQTNFPYCSQKGSNNVSKFNYLKFFFLISQFRKDPEKSKAESLLFVLSKVCNFKKYNGKKLFEEFRIRDDMMKLSKFEAIVKQLLEDEIFFQDINDVWTFIGNPKFITSKNFDKLISQEDIEMLRGSFRSSQQRSDEKSSGFNSRETPQLRSRQQSAYDRRRKQSHQTFGPQVYNLKKDRNSFGRQEQDRSINQSEMQRKKLGIQKQWRDSQMQKKRSGRQKNSYSRERQNEKQRDRGSNQRQRQREKQRQKTSYQRERDREQTSKFQQDGRQQRTNQRSRQNSGRRGKKQQQRQQIPKKKTSVEKRTSMQNNLVDMRRKQPQQKLSKKDLLKKFEQKLQQYTTQELTRLFMSSNKIEKQQMSDCLQRCYEFNHREAVELTEHLSDFGVVKIQTVKKYLRPAGKDRYGEEPSKGRNSKSKTKGVDFSSKNNKDDRRVDPVSNELKNRLINPQKSKLNIPLIKQQIKMFIRAFSQHYAIQQIQKYFFQQSDILYRDEFIKKCRGIGSTSLSEQNIQRMFDYLKPNEKDQVSIVSFKLAFNADDNLGVTEVGYLPKQLVKQLQQIFKQHDKDNSGNIEPAQVESLLSTLGYNESQKQIQAMFKKIDKNFDNQISFQEFKQFIEEFILPQVGEWQNDVQEIFCMLKMNDVFGLGRIALNVVMALMEKYGVKITMQQGLALAKCIGTQNGDIPIYDFLYVLYHPTHPLLSSMAKSALYKIKYRKKISLKEIQKTFANISSNFIMAYTSKIIKTQQLKKSTCFEPVLHESYLFYNDYFYKDWRKVSWNGKNEKLLVEQDPKGFTTVVQIRVPEAIGVPIPQSQNVKSAILKRSLNITFFDMSSQSAKHSIISLQADWDGQIEDQWVFDSKNRSFYMKIANYDSKKYEKMLVLFQLIITMSDSTGNMIEVSCGTASIGIKELVTVDSKLSKKLKLTSGIPTKPKQIDRQAVSKRSGWKTFLGSSTVQSQLSIDIFAQRNIDTKPTLAMIYALPSICLVKRKSLHYVWTFREYFADRSVDRDSTINPDYNQHHTVKAFLLSLDIDDISTLIMNFWRDKIQSSIKNINEARCVMYNLLTDLYMILCTRQFELKLSNPCGTVIMNKNLFVLRQRMVQEMLENIENFVKTDLPKGTQYKRLKGYSYSYQHTKREYFGDSLIGVIQKGLVNIKSQ